MGAWRKAQVKEPQLQIVVDSREQLPYSFDGAIRKALATGDYSVLSMEDSIAIERKSLSDLLGCIGAQRERFERELKRLHSIPFRALVVEATLRDLLTAPSQLHPNSIIGSLCSWIMKYQLPILFCGNRSMAERMTMRLLVKGAKYCSAAGSAASGTVGEDDRR